MWKLIVVIVLGNALCCIFRVNWVAWGCSCGQVVV